VKVYANYEDTNLVKKVEDLMQKGILFDEHPRAQPGGWREARLKDPESTDPLPNW